MYLRIGLWVLVLSGLLLGTAACYHLPFPGDYGYSFRPHDRGDWAAWDETGATEILPAIHPGKFNVAFVYGGDVATEGWNIAHELGRAQVEAEVEGVHTAYVEFVSEGRRGEATLWELLDSGYDAIVATSFIYEETLWDLAAAYPERYFLNVSGRLYNDTNMATLFGAMENARYLAGMAAGARAAADGSRRVGYVGSFPYPEMVRLANATALGMHRTCPDCRLDLEWKHSWNDRELETFLAHELLDDGATVLVAGADSLTPLLVAQDRGMQAVSSNHAGACDYAPEACLGAPYWNWGPFYVAKVQSMMDGTFAAGHFYHDFREGIAGFYGFMEGETPQPGIPAEAVAEIRTVLAEMQSGEFDRFDIFTGPLADNQGNERVPAGVSLTQSDLEGIHPYWSERLNRPGCAYCMNWLVEGFVPGAGVPE